MAAVSRDSCMPLKVSTSLVASKDAKEWDPIAFGFRDPTVEANRKSPEPKVMYPLDPT